MYRAEKKYRRDKSLYIFGALVVLLIIIGFFISWFVLSNGSTTTTNFNKSGTAVATLKPKTINFTNQLFSITLPDGWASKGVQNPGANEYYYDFQNTKWNTMGGELKVYVDNYPSDLAFSKLLPVLVIKNKITTLPLSDNCSSFEGAPSAHPNTSNPNQYIDWIADWQNIKFTCDMSSAHTAGTANSDGYGATLRDSNGVSHKYFFFYNDSNVTPNYQVFVDAVHNFRLI